MGLALRQRQRQEPWAAFKACVLRIACMYGSVSQKEKEREQEREWEVAVRGHTCEYIDDQAGRRGVVINTHGSSLLARGQPWTLTHIRPFPERPAEHVKAR